MKVSIGLLLLFVTLITPVYAANFEWDAYDNTQCENSTCSGFKLYWSNISGGPYSLEATILGGSETQYPVPNTHYGTSYWVLTVYDTIQESGYSNEVHSDNTGASLTGVSFIGGTMIGR